MKRPIILSISFLVLSLSVHAQKHAVVLLPKAGIGFADGTSCIAFGGDIGYQFFNNRISFGFLTGSVQRQEYSNGDYRDVIIGNVTSKYSRIFKAGLVSIVPEAGFGLVTGKWEEYDGYFGGAKIQSGFGLVFGCGIEYSLTDYVLLKLSYEQALLLKDSTGNGSFLAGAGFKIFRKDRKSL